MCGGGYTDAKVSEHWIEESRKLWRAPDNKIPDVEQLTVGCLQRIAQSLENMEAPYLRLLEEQKWYSDRHKDMLKEADKYRRQIAGLKGYIKRIGE